MAWRPKPKNATSDVHRGPWATCDSCGFQYHHPDLQWQVEWSGFNLVNKRTLVCPNKCKDVPQEQFRTLVLPPDPDPVFDARPEQYSVDEGLMPLVTEPAYPGDPGRVFRDDKGRYIGIEP